MDENGYYQFINLELKSHECSPEELGQSGSSEMHKFWPINKQQEKILNFELVKYFYCVDQSELAVSGNINSQQSQLIFIDIVKCSADDEV